MSDSNKTAAAVYGKNAAGQKVLRGHNIVDKSGHLVLLAGDRPLPKGARYATTADVKSAEKHADALAAKDKVDNPEGGPLKA